ncbi:uncharacterized protein [Palaemon carinicauda]|uniref:uncharacterized protein n=1 Tax=Palaemon carinicauda TaxID=392227 RepID=UPI0035B62728
MNDSNELDIGDRSNGSVLGGETSMDETTAKAVAEEGVGSTLGDRSERNVLGEGETSIDETTAKANAEEGVGSTLGDRSNGTVVDEGETSVDETTAKTDSEEGVGSTLGDRSNGSVLGEGETSVDGTTAKADAEEGVGSTRKSLSKWTTYKTKILAAPELYTIKEDKVASTPDSPRGKCFTEIRKRLKMTMSGLWDYNGQFDPFQVFEVEHESCLDFEITIKRGESITKGSAFNDLLDTPDPYVILRIPGCSNSSKRTSHIDNCVNPMWDETFHFYLDPSKEHILKVILMDANYTLDETLGEDTFCVNELTNDVPIDHTFVFPGGSKVHARLKLEKNKVPDLRFSLALCAEEKEYLLTRRQKVLASLQSLMGTRAPDTDKQVPILGILGSGGGFRAMTCLSGAVKALQETGILDCATYIAGLSGSSWYISTLYAHDQFPYVTHSQIQSELRDSVTNDWKQKLWGFHKYIASMAAKYKKGQPVSFTDFFGHLLGDVLLKGDKHKKLTDMQKFLVQGIVPLPLFTCLHAKRNVSCRSFSEWVEFSPYEIGIAKYGTFMKTQDFGNKFIVGKKIKHFDELPLHFLQGVWGSAFTILFKRLVMEGGKKDIVQIMRDAQKEKESDFHDRLNDQNNSEEDSDSEDEEDIVGEDDVSEEELNGDFQTPCAYEPQREGNVFFPSEETIPEDRKVPSRRSSMEKAASLDERLLAASKEQREDLSESVDSLAISESKKKENRNPFTKGFSLELPKRKTSKDNAKNSSTKSGPVDKESQKSQPDRLVRKGAIKGPSLRKSSKEEAEKKSPENNNTSKDKWANRRSTFRKQRVEKKGLWDGLKQSIMTGANILNSRAGRAGEVLNPFRGLSLRHSFPISPFTETLEEEDQDEMDIGKGCRYEPLDNKAKKLFIVDSGLAFNSPYPLLLRPQRAVDIYLSFDFSQRPEDKHHPFKELILAESWAVQNKVPFPPIKKMIEQYKNEEVRECYIFKHPSDQFCPVILHFPLVNNLFKKFKKPGVPRETEEEKKFADFPIFDDPNNPYSSMNFCYEPIQFDRLTQLVEFNTLLCVDTIKNELAEVISRKKQYAQKPMSISDVVNTVKRVNSIHRIGSSSNLKLKLPEERESQLKQYIKQSRTLERQQSMDSSEGEFCDAVEELPDGVDGSARHGRRQEGHCTNYARRPKRKGSDFHDRLNDQNNSEEDSDSEDEEDIVGEDDVSEEELNGDFQTPCAYEPQREGNVFFPSEEPIPEDRKVPSRRSSMEKAASLDERLLVTSKEQREDLSESVDSLAISESKKKENRNPFTKGFSLELPKRKTSKDNAKNSSTKSGPVDKESQKSQPDRLVRKGAIKGPSLRKSSKEEAEKKSPENNNTSKDKWANRRSTFRKQRVEKKGLWDGLKQSIMTGANILNSRAGRAGEVLNPFRGLSLRHSFPISPFTETLEEEDQDEMDIGKGCRYEPLDNKAKKLFIVDSGLAFNSPYPLLLRPQRAVDIYLSFDFSQRPEDKHHPFKELILAESWAVQNKVPFPPIKKMIEQYKNEEVRECYIFKHPSDQFCPVILHFPLVNNLFKKFKKPGVPRETEEEKKFADFPIFDDPNNPYSSMNFCYEPIQFDRLTQLVEFNTLLCVDTIKNELAEVISRKKQYAQKPMSISDVVNTVKRVNSIHRIGSSSNLKLKLPEERESQLKQYIKQSRTLERQQSMDSSEGEFCDAVEELPDGVDGS